VIDDPIAEELRAYRKAFSEAHGNDLLKIVEALRLREKVADVPKVRFAPKLAENSGNHESSIRGTFINI